MRTRSSVIASLGLAIAFSATGCGVIDAGGTQGHLGRAAVESVYWDSPPEKVDAAGRPLDEAERPSLPVGETFEVLCLLSIGDTDFYRAERTEEDGWSSVSWETWLYADEVEVKRLGTEDDFGTAGDVPDDVGQCNVEEPEIVTGPEAPDTHHSAFIAREGEPFYFSVLDVTFNDLRGGGEDALRLPDGAAIDVHCVNTTRNIVEEPPSTSYNEEVPYYLATYDGNTGYVDPLWVYFADDPASVPADLAYDPRTGTVSDHGDVPALEECPA